jgi:hypothetical protein
MAIRSGARRLMRITVREAPSFAGAGRRQAAAHV